LTLSWNASTDSLGVIGYRVYRDGTLVASPGGTSASITGLSTGVPYSFTVSAFDVVGNVSALSTPLSVTLQQILWSAGMEMGNLSEWSEEVVTGNAASVAVTAASVGIPPKGGNWVMQQSVLGASGVAEASGTRMFRYEPLNTLARAGTTVYWSWWDYFPTTITFGPYDSFILWSVVGKDAVKSYNPVYSLVFHNSGNTLDLVWSPNNRAPDPGPHIGESGWRRYSSSTPVPVGQWVFFEAMITPKPDFTGALKIWMNGQVLFDLSQVKTMYPDTGQGDPLFALEQTSYGSNLTPMPCVHYVDNVTLSLGRVPYAP
jgi:hypothetical protein